jgi:hypothetical protein
VAGVVDTLRGVVRAALGLPADPGAPPDLLRLGLYRARVDAAASDGSKLDVTPEDTRISPEKNVPLRVGIPGAVHIAKQGDVVLLGWERGDPARPYCAPHWETGATISKLTLNVGSQTLVMDDNAGNVQVNGADSKAVLDKLVTDVLQGFSDLKTCLNQGTAGGPTKQVITGATAFALTPLCTGSASDYESTKVKIGK